MITKLHFEAAAGKSAASVSDEYPHGRVLIYDHDSQCVQAEVALPEDCGRSVALSPDGRLLATGYWHRKGIDVRETDTQDVVATLGPSKVSGVLFDRTSQHLIFHADSGTYAREIQGNRSIRISNCESLDSASFSHEGNTLIIPLTRKGRVGRLSFAPLKCAETTLDVASTISWLRHSPRGSVLFTIDRNKTVRCFSAISGAAVWVSDLRKLVRRDFVYVGSYSGDGSLIGITVTQRDGFRVIVLDANTGEVQSEYTGQRCCGYPYYGSRVLLENGVVLDLANGHTDNAIAEELAEQRFTSGRA